MTGRHLVEVEDSWGTVLLRVDQPTPAQAAAIEAALPPLTETQRLWIAATLARQIADDEAYDRVCERRGWLPLKGDWGMPIHAAWPRSRRRALARLLGQQITIRDLHADRARLQRALDAARDERDLALYLHAEATWQLDTWQAHTTRFLDSDACLHAKQEVARLNRLLVSQADHLAAARRENDELHADIARLRPVLMPRDTT